MDEYLDIVNEADEVIGRASRDEIYSQKLRHRIVHVLIFNDKGEMALQLRSKQKSFCPGHWSTAVGGHVQQGETYEQAALREYKEELGEANAISLLSCDEFIDQNAIGLRKFLGTFIASHNGPFDFNKEEVEDVKFFSVEEIRNMLNNGEKFHPELSFILHRHYAAK